MKLLNSIIFGSLALLFLNSAALAQNNSANFSLNQANQNLSLEQQEFETIYRTDQVPDTCYRDEVQGSRQECRTEYDRRCHYERVPVCQNIPRSVCAPVQRCYTRMERVCNSRGCVDVPRRICQTVNQCSTRMERVCHTEQRQVCETFPRQSCVNVPIIVRVPYACTRPVQVPAGQRLKLKTLANVSIQFANLNEIGPTADILTASLSNGVVKISAQGQPSFLYRVVALQRSEQMISATEKLVTYSISIHAVSLQKLNEFLSSQMVNPALFKNRIEFSFLGRMDVPFKGHLQVLRSRRVMSAIEIVDADFLSTALITQGNISQLMLSPFGVGTLENKSHQIRLRFSLDLQNLQQGLINPQSLNQVANRSIDLNFEEFPRL